MLVPSRSAVARSSMTSRTLLGHRVPSGRPRSVLGPIMEAATPLPFSQVRTHAGRLWIDGLVVDDASAVRLAREREQHGEDVSRLVLDAIAIGARVLDREQTGANADFVKAEFEKAAR